MNKKNIFIKTFNLMNLLMAILFSYVLYRTALIFNFFRLFVDNANTLLEVGTVDNVISIIMFVITVIVFILSILMFASVLQKKKPPITYLIGILVSFSNLFLFLASYFVIVDAYSVMADIINIQTIRDVSLVLLIFEFILIIYLLLRTFGFKKEKFNFDEASFTYDELLVDEKKSIITERDKYKFRRFKREFGYFYRERKFFVNFSVLVLFLAIIGVFYLNIGIYNKVYREKEKFSTSKFNIGVKESYVTNKSYNGDLISDDLSLLVINMEIKSKDMSRKLGPASILLEYGGKKHFPTKDYREKLKDLGIDYDSHSIEQDKYSNYLFVFEVPKDFKYSDAKILYDDGEKGFLNLEKRVRITLNPIFDANESKTFIAAVGEDLVFEKGFFDKRILNIKNVKFAAEFVYEYSYCAAKDLCYDSVEYINSNLFSNYDRALIKIEGSFILDDKEYSILNLVNNYGVIEYVDGIAVTKNIYPLTEIKSQKESNNMVHYFEVPANMLESRNVTIVFKMRNIVYKYNLKNE